MLLQIAHRALVDLARMLPDDEKTLDAGSAPLVSANVSAVLGSRLVYHYDHKVDPSVEVGTGLLWCFSLA